MQRKKLYCAVCLFLATMILSLTVVVANAGSAKAYITPPPVDTGYETPTPTPSPTPTDTSVVSVSDQHFDWANAAMPYVSYSSDNQAILDPAVSNVLNGDALTWVQDQVNDFNSRPVEARSLVNQETTTQVDISQTDHNTLATNYPGALDDNGVLRIDAGCIAIVRITSTIFYSVWTLNHCAVAFLRYIVVSGVSTVAAFLSQFVPVPLRYLVQGMAAWIVISMGVISFWDVKCGGRGVKVTFIRIPPIAIPGCP